MFAITPNLQLIIANSTLADTTNQIERAELRGSALLCIISALPVVAREVAFPFVAWQYPLKSLAFNADHALQL